MKGLILDALYAAALLAASPLWLYRMIRHGRYREDLGQRLGTAPRRYGLQPLIWVHGVSVGEINAARSIVDELHRQLPDFRVAVSTSTETGMARARQAFGRDHVVFRWPLDFSLAVERALARLEPSLVVLLEGEVWPNFLAACNRRRIPAVVVNGRLGSSKGLPRYRRLGSLAAGLFNRLAAIGAQHEIYARQYLQLGVEPEKVHVTGMLKYDTAPVADTIEGQQALAAAMGIRDADRLLVAGGTGPGEEQILLEVFGRLHGRHPDLKLALVPRKPERFGAVAEQIRAAGFTPLRRSERPDGCAPPDGESARVILGDTMGELRKFYALAEICFVGRSLVPMGGSDMIESAALGRPTCFGPHTFNFPQAEDLLAHGCRRVEDVPALESLLGEWLDDPPAARERAERARAFIRNQQGRAARLNVEMICRLLDRSPAVAAGTCATEAIRTAQGA
jgi:3-deoxy-D-manno-octulosonic-acid transferase